MPPPSLRFRHSSSGESSGATSWSRCDLSLSYSTGIELQGKTRIVPSRFTFVKIRNVGRGVALHVRLHAYEKVGDRPTATMSPTTIPLVGASDEVLMSCPISVWFKNVPIIGETTALGITVDATCDDSRGNLYRTEHNLIVVERGDDVIVSRTVTMTPAWRMRLRAKRYRLLLRLRRSLPRKRR